MGAIATGGVRVMNPSVAREAGIVTLEDLLESPVGPIAGAPAGGLGPDGSVRLDGLTRLHDFEELVGARLPDGVQDEVETVGGVVTAVLGRIPEVGEEATVVGRTLRVEGRDGLGVAAVRLLPPDREPPDGTGTAPGLGVPAGLLARPPDDALALATDHPQAAVAALSALL